MYLFPFSAWRTATLVSKGTSISMMVQTGAFLSQMTLSGRLCFTLLVVALSLFHQIPLVGVIEIGDGFFILCCCWSLMISFRSTSPTWSCLAVVYKFADNLGQLHST